VPYSAQAFTNSFPNELYGPTVEITTFVWLTTFSTWSNFEVSATMQSRDSIEYFDKI